jgi:secreted PhoX family phosphatase
MKINRRGFLLAGSAAAGSALAIDRLIAYQKLSSFSAMAASKLIAPRGAGGYGALTPIKSVNTGEPMLALPEGFQYTIIGRAGEKMKDGNLTPLRHDGMATFRIKDELRVVRNHEINNLFGQSGISIGDAKRAYDSLAAGGTTTLVIDPKTRTLIRDFISLGGTLQNCAGGPTPWGSWVTCEETTLGPAKRVDSRQRNVGGFEKPHGYCFEVSASSDTMVDPIPLKAMGRFVHEAIAVDPRTGYVYETEDAGQSGLYRFIPNKRSQLAAGGKLQMLAVKDQPRYQALIGQKVRQPISAIWIDIPEPDPASAETDPASVYKQGLERGGATFARLEGCWYGQGKIFFTSTSGGESRLGQIWQYEPKGKNDGVLTLLFESPDAQHLEGPDNLCVSPRGGLAICEDGRGEQFVRGLTPDGRIFDFARNTIPGHEDKEFAGATFSPDGETLFFNAQTAGLTFAVWGPWKDGAL